MKREAKSTFLAFLLGVSLLMTSCGTDEKTLPPAESTESTTESKEPVSESEVTEDTEGKTTTEKETTEESTTEEPTTQEPTTLSEEEIRLQVEDALQEAQKMGFCRKAVTILDTAYKEYADERLKEAKNALLKKTEKIQTAYVIEASGDNPEEVEAVIEENSSYKMGNKGRSEYEYDTRGNLYREYKYSDSFSDTVEELIQYNHDYDGNVTEETHYVGNMMPVTRVIYEYDGEGHKTYQILYDNEIVKSAAEYDLTGQPLIETEYISGDIDSQTFYEYNEYNDVVSIVQKDASGKTIKTIEYKSTYNDSGKRTGYVQQTNGASDYKATVTWQKDGNRTEHFEYADGHTEDIRYDTEDHMIVDDLYDKDGNLRHYSVYEYENDLLLSETSGYKKDIPSYRREYRYDETGRKCGKTDFSYNDDGSTRFVLAEQTVYDYFDIPLPEDENETPGIPLFAEGPDHEELITSCPDEDAVSYVLEMTYENNWYGESLTELQRKDYDKDEQLLQTVTMKWYKSSQDLLSRTDKEKKGSPNEVVYDEWGEKFYDENGNLILYAPLGNNEVYFYKYNKKNQKIEEIYGERDYGVTPDLDMPYTFRYKYKYTYDDSGREIKREQLGEDNTLYRIREIEYNKQSDISSWTDFYLDENEKRTPQILGEYTYDKQGNLTLYRMTDVSGNVYEETKNTYDDGGILLNQFIKTYGSYEYKYYEYEYDQDGKVKRKNQFQVIEDTVVSEEEGGLVGWTTYEHGTFGEQ